VQALAQQLDLAAITSRQQQRQMSALHDEVMQRIRRGQHRARGARFQHAMRMHHRAVQASGYRHAQQALGAGQHQSAQQHRADVVTVARAAGDRLAADRVRIQRCGVSGAGSSALAATTAATLDAAEPPRPAA